MNESGKKIDWVLLLSLVVIVGGIIFLVFMGVKFEIFNNFLNNSAKQNGATVLETKYCGYAKKLCSTSRDAIHGVRMATEMTSAIIPDIHGNITTPDAMYASLR